MSGWYPDGVTGNEYAIAGAERAWSEKREMECTNEECAAFEEPTLVEIDLESYGSQEWGWWTCPTCGKDYEYEGDVEVEEYEPEPEY